MSLMESLLYHYYFWTYWTFPDLIGYSQLIYVFSQSKKCFRNKPQKCSSHFEIELNFATRSRKKTFFLGKVWNFPTYEGCGIRNGFDGDTFQRITNGNENFLREKKSTQASPMIVPETTPPTPGVNFKVSIPKSHIFKDLGGYSQNYLWQILKIFITLIWILELILHQN